MKQSSLDENEYDGEEQCEYDEERRAFDTANGGGGDPNLISGMLPMGRTSGNISSTTGDSDTRPPTPVIHDTAPLPVRSE